MSSSAISNLAIRGGEELILTMDDRELSLAPLLPVLLGLKLAGRCASRLGEVTGPGSADAFCPRTRLRWARSKGRRGRTSPCCGYSSSILMDVITMSSSVTFSTAAEAVVNLRPMPCACVCVGHAFIYCYCTPLQR